MPQDTQYVRGLDATFYNIGVYNRDFHKATERSIEKAGKFFMGQLRNNVSLTDHSLDDLRKLDHPYARRHSSIRRPPGHRYKWQIHSRGGALVKGLWDTMSVSRVPLGRGIEVFTGTFWGGIRPEVAEHINYVIEGTRVMHGRSVVERTFHANATSIKKRIIRSMGKAHTHAVGRFREVRSV